MGVKVLQRGTITKRTVQWRYRTVIAMDREVQEFCIDFEGSRVYDSAN
jgi:hypothetical protein